MGKPTGLASPHLSHRQEVLAAVPPAPAQLPAWAPAPVSIFTTIFMDIHLDHKHEVLPAFPLASAELPAWAPAPTFI